MINFMPLILHLTHISQHTSVYMTHKRVDTLPAVFFLAKFFFMKYVARCCNHEPRAQLVRRSYLP